jgi:hypothetical protein
MSPAVATLPSTSEALQLLDRELDLGNLRMKLADTEEGPSLSEARLDVMETEYRKFLALHLAHPDAEIVPCKTVDQMWHQHILDTAAYREDCEAIFGHYLDHFPYFGMRGEDDARALHDAYDDTLDRYREAFGEPPAETWILADDASSRCGRTACKPQKCK